MRIGTALVVSTLIAACAASPGVLHVVENLLAAGAIAFVVVLLLLILS